MRGIFSAMRTRTTSSRRWYHCCKHAGPHRRRRKAAFRTLPGSTACGCSSASRAKPRVARRSWCGADYSDPVRIAAWYESSGRATAPVPLPDPVRREFPEERQTEFVLRRAVGPDERHAGHDALRGCRAELRRGAATAVGLTWICSFSIPLITICAFFVLNIFLSLLNIVFFWMAFIKICIPFPAPAAPTPPTQD